MAQLPPRDDIIYYSTKTWEHVVSVAFRQAKADSHCKYIHGYALTIKAIFGAHDLDVRNWVVDFGSLKSFKGWLETNFDHKLVIAKDDPALPDIKRGAVHGPAGKAADIREVEATGCEAFARLCFEWLEAWLQDNGYTPRCWVQSLEVCEHSGNSAMVVLRKLPLLEATEPYDGK